MRSLIEIDIQNTFYFVGGQGKLKYKEHLTNYWIDDCLDAAE